MSGKLWARLSNSVLFRPNMTLSQPEQYLFEVHRYQIEIAAYREVVAWLRLAHHDEIAHPVRFSGAAWYGGSMKVEIELDLLLPWQREAVLKQRREQPKAFSWAPRVAEHETRMFSQDPTIVAVRASCVHDRELEPAAIGYAPTGKCRKCGS